MRFTVFLEPDTGGYHIYSPNFPGCHSQGESEVEALRNFAEALEGRGKLDHEEGTAATSERADAFERAAGSWKGLVDAQLLKANICGDRLLPTRQVPEL